MAKKDLPERIWLDAGSCWNEKPQGEGYVEYVSEDYHAKAMLHVLQKGVEQGKKQALEEFEKNRLEHCDNITEEQYNLESGFVTSHLEKHHRIPTILDAIEYGLEKGKKEILDKACKCLKANFVELYLHYMRGTSEDEIVDEFREYLKKAMEDAK